MSAPAPARVDVGRVLLAIYALFAVAATARSAVQIGSRFPVAPLAYLLSAAAAAVYLVGTVVLRRATAGHPVRRTLIVLSAVELAGVLAVGTASLLVPAAFPDATVWSHYGSGYGFVPAALPIAVLLRYRSRGAGAGTYAAATAEPSHSGPTGEAHRRCRRTPSSRAGSGD